MTWSRVRTRVQRDWVRLKHGVRAPRRSVSLVPSSVVPLPKYLRLVESLDPTFELGVNVVVWFRVRM